MFNGFSLFMVPEKIVDVLNINDLVRVAQWFNTLPSNQESGSLNPGGYLGRL